MFLLILTIVLAAVTAAPYNSQRIVGGSVTDIATYPFGVSLLFTFNGITFIQACGGTILNNRSILSATHCFVHSLPSYWRSRVGSTNANSGGVVHLTQTIFKHPEYDENIYDNDIAVLRVTTKILFNNNVKAGSFAGTNYNLPDNAAVWAIGWGNTIPGMHSVSEALRHVQVWVVNHDVCRTHYAELGNVITDNMLCSGWLDVGGRDQCTGDSGGPLVHNNVVVGVCSWGESCALSRYPGVNARVSRYRDFIQNNA